MVSILIKKYIPGQNSILGEEYSIYFCDMRRKMMIRMKWRKIWHHFPDESFEVVKTMQ